MNQGRPTLRLSGYSYAERLEDIFASYMVDVAYLIEVTDVYALVAPDDPESVDLNKTKDRDWLKAVIQQTMKAAGEGNVQVTYVPANT